MCALNFSQVQGLQIHRGQFVLELCHHDDLQNSPAPNVDQAKVDGV